MFLQQWISNLQDPPQSQSLETVPVCIVWQYYPHDNIVYIHMCDEYIEMNRFRRLSPLVFFGLLTGSHRPAFEAHPGANTFPSVCGLTTTSFTDPSASRNTFSVSTITDGNARVGGRSTLSTLTLA